MKKQKFIAGASLLATGVLALSGCGSKYSGVKVGLILLHPAESSTYDRNFHDAVVSAANEYGFKYIEKSNIPEYSTQVTTTADELVAQGCNMIFADSFGHEEKLFESAAKHPEVKFCHATGTSAAGSSLSNVYNAFASIYEGRYLAGIVAGKKLEAMIAANPSTPHKVGYVGAFPYAEVISGYTAWYLGVKSIVNDVTMSVRYTSSWYDEAGEGAAATALIDTDGVAIVSQHADSYGAPTVCETKGVPNVSYNYSTAQQGPNTYLVASKIDWSAYVKHVVDAIANGTAVTQDYVGTLKNGGVKVLECSSNCPAGTQEAVNAAAEQLKSGDLHVFDITKFTIGGETPNNTNMAPSKQYTYDYPAGTEFVKDGYFHESEYRSAPYLDHVIDGITAMN